MIVLSGTMPQY